MSCHLTEEVSLLVDGELSPDEAARLRAHVEGCAACRQAREVFLLLRQELRAYEHAPDSHAQSRALAAILGSSTSEAAAGQTTQRGIFGWLTESLAGAISLSRLRPAHVAALALLLAGAVLGVLWLKSLDTQNRAPQSDADTVAKTDGLPAPTPNVKGPEKSEVIDDQLTRQANAPHHASVAQHSRENARVRGEDRRTGLQSQEGSGRDVRQEVARVSEPTPLPSSPGGVALYTAAGLRATAADPAVRFGRHAERVERLLRSFRNARLTESDPTLDVADARRLSKRLLYTNIALRREAASAGDLPAEGLLERVEPILLDIANLPDAPPPDAVGSIKERIHRQQLVGALQAQAAPFTR